MVSRAAAGKARPSAAFREAWLAGVEDEIPPEDRALLDATCELMDRIAAMKAKVEEDGLTVFGSMQQPRAHPLLAEVRQAEVALARMLESLRPEDEAPARGATEAGRALARARYDGQRTGRRAG
jgi:hypothetical protein